ncbi:MAG: glutamate--tRNA ligase [Clostridia bacterium]|nr:glutamate--tRNA ligase [Clostridia bacterium]
MDTIRTRFAPSPTGYLHIGGLRTALYCYLYAKKNNGKFILRIEDTDQARYVEGTTEIIYANLKDAGLLYDEGPDVGGQYGPYIQSQRKADYLKYARILIEQGDAYYCFCDKDRLEQLHQQGATKYDKHCLSLSKTEIESKLAQGVPYVIRQNIPSSGTSTYTDCVFGEIAVDNSELEDNVLIKSDGLPTYNFANVIDDHLMGINVVMRGTEYLSSTPKYNLLYDALGWQRPIYIHMPPIMRDEKHKLSKRDGAASYDDFIANGFLSQAIVNYIALLGWSPKSNQEKMSLQEMIELFNIEGISRSPSIFDLTKMKWLNSLYVKELPFEQFVQMATPWIDKSMVAGKYDYDKLCKLIQGRIEILSDIPDKINFLAQFDSYNLQLYVNQKQKSDIDIARKVLPLVKRTMMGINEWYNDTIYQQLCQIAQDSGLKNSQILWPTRVALSGQQSTPGGATELAELLGKDESINRINKSIGMLDMTP